MLINNVGCKVRFRSRKIFIYSVIQLLRCLIDLNQEQVEKCVYEWLEKTFIFTRLSLGSLHWGPVDKNRVSRCILKHVIIFRTCYVCNSFNTFQQCIWIIDSMKWQFQNHSCMNKCFRNKRAKDLYDHKAMIFSA